MMQASSRRTVRVVPSARRLILSLRDIGYDFVHAVADLVDNSIAADAATVAVDVAFEGADSWLRVADASRCDEQLVEPLRYQLGTVVLWQQLDRVLGYKLPTGERARNGFLALSERLHDHLGMVFHRFLAGEIPRRRKLTITVNGTKVEPWDPFARDEPATEVLPVREFEVRTSTGIGLVRLRPFVLPRQDRFSSESAFVRAGGPARWNSQQGLYIYRANRMIQSGGWCRMRTKDEHSKLARAALDFHPDLDSAFEVNVAKATVSLPTDLRERLREPIDDLARWAQRVYRQRDAASPSVGEEFQAGSEKRLADSGSAPLVSDQALGIQDDQRPGTWRRADGNAVERIGSALEDAAHESGEYESLRRIAKVLRARS